MAKPTELYDLFNYKFIINATVDTVGVNVTDTDVWEWAILEWGLTGGTFDQFRVTQGAFTFQFWIGDLQPNKRFIIRLEANAPPTINLLRVTGAGGVGCLVTFARGYPCPIDIE